MVVLAPVPTWIATLTNTVQKEKMKATDARVQDVTESELFSFLVHLRYMGMLMIGLAVVMSMLRMIKLFGWENRVERSIAEKREGELKWIWKRKLLGMLWSMVK